MHFVGLPVRCPACKVVTQLGLDSSISMVLAESSGHPYQQVSHTHLAIQPE